MRGTPEDTKGTVGSVVVTVIVWALLVFLATKSVLFAVLGFIMLLIWVLERGSNYLRPKVEATTEGPPPQHVGWKSTSRFGSDELEQGVVRAIERGDPASEPPGLRLIEL